jgi:hypothetical protein
VVTVVMLIVGELGLCDFKLSASNGSIFRACCCVAVAV